MMRRVALFLAIIVVSEPAISMACRRTNSRRCCRNFCCVTAVCQTKGTGTGPQMQSPTAPMPTEAPYLEPTAPKPPSGRDGIGDHDGIGGSSPSVKRQWTDYASRYTSMVQLMVVEETAAIVEKVNSHMLAVVDHISETNPSIAQARLPLDNKDPISVNGLNPERGWVDNTGTYCTQAALLSVSNGMVRLKKFNGAIIRVPMERLSADDRNYVDSFNIGQLVVSK